MIGDLKPYPTMKDSGVEWLGRVPEHWTTPRTKTLLQERSQKGLPNEPLLAATQSKGVVRKDKFESRTVLALKDLHLLKLVCVGDFVISLRSFQGGIESARDRGIISPAYTVLSPRRPSDHAFLSYLFKSRPYVEGLGLFVTGIRQGQNIDYEKLARSRLPLPPDDEQAAIVRYLDHVDRRVRRLVRAKRKLIALLTEQKQGIIHRAVTRGLDPNVPLKDSGVEWLGELPEHWDVLALKRVLRRLIDCEHKTAPAVDESEFRVVRTTAVRNGGYSRAGTYGTTIAAYREWTRRGVPEPGDVIFTREAPAGEACVVPPGEPVCLGQRTVLMKLKPKDYCAEFLVFMIYAGPPRTRIHLASQGSTVGHFNMDDIGWMRIYRPPLSEQREIAEHLCEAMRDIDSAIHRANSEVGLLNEYHCRLIADVVTGKLDVREAAAALPEADPLDAEDEQGEALEPDGDVDIDESKEIPEEVGA